MLVILHVLFYNHFVHAPLGSFVFSDLIPYHLGSHRFIRIAVRFKEQFNTSK